MYRSLVSRLLDWLIVIAIVCSLLWLLITQPLLTTQRAGDLPTVNQSNLKNHIINLRHIDNSRDVAKESLSTDNYILNYFSRLGNPSLQGYSTMGGRHNNVRLRLGPNTAERLVIGAQYLPPTGVNRKFWNPSGVAVLLETARVLSQAEADLPIAVEFVAYASAGVAANGTLEMGSFHHAKQLKDANIPVKLMIALRSVGYYRSEQGSQRYPFSFMKMLYPDVGDFVALSSRLQDFTAIRSVKGSFSSIPKLSVESFSAPENFPLVSGSDHVNYWLNDYPAIQVSDMLPLRAPATNFSGENLELNYERMSLVVQALSEVVKAQRVGEVQPDDPARSPSLLARVAGFFD